MNKFGGGGEPQFNAGKQIQKGLEDKRLQPLDQRALDRRGETPDNVKIARESFTTLAFEAQRAGIPRIGETSHPEGARVQELLNEADRLLEQARLKQGNINEAGREAVRNILEVQNILNPQAAEAELPAETVIIPEYNAEEAAEAMAIAERKEKIDAWKTLLVQTGEGEGLSDADLTRMAEGRVDGKDLDVDDTVQDEEEGDLQNVG